MKNFYIVTNNQKDKDFSLTNRISNKLIAIGARVLTKRSSEIDCVISIGGDGTMIQAAREMADLDVAFVGVNMGTLGFLTEIAPESVDIALERLVNDDYTIEERMMLKASSDNISEQLALNDVIMTRSGSVTVVEYQVSVNGSPLVTYRADGVLISTPTGSTGYNLSAGGPIVEPNSQVMTLTPICAHTLNSRSVILNGDDVVTIKPVWNSQKGQVIAAFDGDGNIQMEEGEILKITASDQKTRIISLDQESFVTALSRKLN